MMMISGNLDRWYADAVLRVYGPWLTSTCVGIGAQQRREVAELIDRARRAAALPPLDLPAAESPAVPIGMERTPSGLWSSAAA